MFIVVLGGAVPAVTAADLEQDWRRAVQEDRLDFIHRHLHDVNNVDLATERGKTALMAAAGRGAAELARALLARGAAVNARNRNAGSALLYAAWSGDVETVRVLLEHGAAVAQQSGNGWSALMMAAAKGHGPVAGLLLARGAPVDLSDIYGWTPLMRAAYAGHEEVVAVLLAQPDIVLERVNDQGQTALHLAVIQENVPIARRLLARGANPDTRDRAGQTPRTIASTLGHRQLAELLSSLD